MKNVFSKWLAALLCAALLLTGSAMMEEEIPVGVDEIADEIVAESVEEEVAPEEPVELAEEPVEAEEPVPEEAESELPYEEPASDEEVLAEEMEAEEYAQLMAAEGGIPIDAAHFPDASFRKYVSEHYDLDKNGILEDSVRNSVISMGGQMHKENGIQFGFYTINIAGKGETLWSAGIASLKGIEYFPNLQRLECGHNPIKTLDVRTMTKLKYLDCMECGMTSLTLGDLKSLETLCCSYNKLTSLNVNGCTNLKTLDVFDNALSKLDLTGCQYFKGLPAGFSSVTSYFWVHNAKRGRLEYWKDLGKDAHGVFIIHSVFCDTNVSINGMKPGVTAASLPTGFSPVSGAAAAKVTVVANSTVKNTKATVVAAPGAKTQLNLNGAKGKKFKSSNKKVATVDKNGVVTFKKAGKVKITFKIGKATRKVTFTIHDPTVPSSVTLSQSGTVAVKKGESTTLTATIPKGTNSAIKWKSSNKKVATVKNGVVKFKKAGKVTITATTVRGKKKARVTFKVSK